MSSKKVITVMVLSVFLAGTMTSAVVANPAAIEIEDRDNYNEENVNVEDEDPQETPPIEFDEVTSENVSTVAQETVNALSENNLDEMVENYSVDNENTTSMPEEANHVSHGLEAAEQVYEIGNSVVDELE